MQVEFSFRDKANNFKYQQPLTRLVRPLNLETSDYSEDTRNSLGITFGDKSKKSRNSLHVGVSWDCFTSSSQKEDLNKRSIPTDVNYTALQRVLKNRNQTKLDRYAGSKHRLKVLDFSKNESQ